MNYYDYLNVSLSAAFGDAQTRWTNAKTALKTNSYTANQWTNDALSVWFGFMQPFWNVWGATMECPLPIVGFNVLQGTSSTQPSTVVVLPPVGTPPPVDKTDLLEEGGSHKVNAADVVASLTDAALTVNLTNLAGLPRANYQGAIYFGGQINRVAALVHLVIS